MYLDEFLTVIKTNLNIYLNEINLTSGVEYVKVQPVKNNAGQPNQINDSVAMFVINMDLEPREDFNTSTRQVLADGSIQITEEPQLYKVIVFLTALYDDYLQSLKLKSQIANFFATNKVLNEKTYPGLSESESNFHIIYIILTIEMQNQIWGMLGMSMQPGLLYEMTVRLGQSPAPIEMPAVKEAATVEMERI